MIQIDACKNGDREALGELYAAYAHKLRGVCLHYIKDESTAEDILHDAFVIIFMSLKGLKDHSKLEGWMITIVRNLSLKHLRSMERSEVPLSQLDMELTEENLEEEFEGIDLEVLLSAIEKLPEGNRAVFKLSVLDGLSHKEIGELLGIAPHSSSSQLFRAKKMLRAMLNDYWVVLLLPAFVPLFIYFIARDWNENPSANCPTIVKTRREETAASPSTGRAIGGNKPDEGSGAATRRRNAKGQRHVVKQAVDATMNIAYNEAESLSAVLNSDSLQTSGTIEEGAAQVLFRNSLSRPTTIHELARVAFKQKNSYPWNFGFASASNAGANGALSNLNYLSVVDYAKGGAMTRLYTWDDYAHYMSRNEVLMDSLERARMSLIALNRPSDDDSPLGEVARHYRPQSFGLSVSKQLSPRWTFGTGLIYTRLRSDFESTYHNTRLKKVQKIDYAGIPLRLTYRVWERGRLNAYMTGGITYEMPVHSSLDKQFVVTADSAYTLKGDIKARSQWSVNMGVGVQYRLFKPFSLYLEPNVFYYFNNSSGLETYRTAHPVVITLPLGLRLTW